MESPTIVSSEAKPVLARRPVAVLAVKSGPAGAITKYASVLMPEQMQEKTGVRGEAIMGRFVNSEGPLAPENFVQNRDFVRFVQGVIARHAAQCPPLAAEAARVHKGLVYVLDGRRDPAASPSPEDILGTAIIEDDRVKSYEPAAGYAVFTRQGFMCLEEWLHARLIEELMALPVAKITLERVVDEAPGP